MEQVEKKYHLSLTFTITWFKEGQGDPLSRGKKIKFVFKSSCLLNSNFSRELNRQINLNTFGKKITVKTRVSTRVLYINILMKLSLPLIMVSTILSFIDYLKGFLHRKLTFDML